MKYKLRNLLLNPVFEFWDYSTSITASGYSANQWKLARSGGTPPTVTVSQGTTGATTATPLWYRNKPCLSIDISNLGSADANTQIRQVIEAGTRFSTEHVCLSMIVHGPAGATFQCGANGQYETVTTLGDTAGVDIPVFVQITNPLNTVATTLSCDIFNKPSMIGVYKIVIAQLEVLEKDFAPSSWEFRDSSLERMLLNRYAIPVNSGTPGVSSTTSLFLDVKFPVPMRVPPTYIDKLTAIGSLKTTQMTSGTETTSTVLATHTATNISTHGARVAISGAWAGLTNGSIHMLTTDAVGLLDAAY
jgi:hypothetical protein